MKLPGGNRADLGSKIEDYVLTPGIGRDAMGHLLYYAHSDKGKEQTKKNIEYRIAILNPFHWR